MKDLAIGIDLGGTNLKGVVMDEAGSYRHLSRTPTQAERGGAQVLANILGLVETLIGKEGSRDRIRGVGIGTPGFVDGDGTMLGGAENLPGWKGTQIYAPIRTRFGLPATASNDVTVAALAEQRYGAGRGIRNLACFALGTGVGGGIVVNGHVYKGTHGMAAELGHIVVQSDGIVCTCGVRGCVEQYASATGIVKNARMLVEAAQRQGRASPFTEAVHMDPEGLTSRTVYDFVKQGDPVALEVNEFVCDMLARAIGAILNTLAPDRIILGGGVMMAGQVIIDTTVKHLPKYCWAQIRERCDVVAARCGENAGVLGAGALVFEDIPG